MKFYPKNPPRNFAPSQEFDVSITDVGDIHLLPDEQVSFVTDNQARYDFVRKNWGFYATPSINGRLKNEGFKTALVENEKGRIYIMVVELMKSELFEDYCIKGNQKIIRWLDEYPY